MKVKNIEQTLAFKAWRLLSVPIPESFSKVLKTGDQEKIIAAMPEPVKRELTKLGVKMLNDDIDVKLNLGMVIYDIYACHTELPKAPFLLKQEEGVRQQMVQELSSEEFELSDNLIDLVSSVLKSDEKWVKNKFFAIAKPQDGAKEIGLPISHEGVFNFKEIIDGLLKIAEKKETKES